MDRKKEFTEKLGKICKEFGVAEIADMKYENISGIETVKITFESGKFVCINVSRDSMTMLLVDVFQAILQGRECDNKKAENFNGFPKRN